ncbi:hypothetical protein L227DRAFT_437034 [Lentinus tigrinus ALCF2SS1-6]|uniref:F-box domain-containing protein n=1 Tax=Lentinus tigrinus ALCF2SS1-6 TaxID=1328759 RepID=A0A5C2SMT5_9APHY|nr:hypothetical protein L227DRAFT_437034 [Lentinus tigrinus ALCF2SS1-6]
MDNCILNFDIFELIMVHATRDTVSKIMRTCHLLTRESGRHLLGKDGVVELHTENDAQSFLAFLVARGDEETRMSRMKCVRSLILSFGPAPLLQQTIIPAALFNGLARLAFNFVHLEINDAEAFFYLDPTPRLARTVASVRTLQKLVIRNGGRRTVWVLGQLQSRLRDVGIYVDLPALEADLRALSPGARNLSWLLARSALQLQTLNLQAPLSFSTTGQRFPVLSELTLSKVDPPAEIDYYDAFPQLAFLHVFDLIPQMVFTPQGLRDQHRQRSSLPQQHHARKPIREVSGPLPDVYMLGLKCRTEIFRTWEDLDGDGWNDDMEDMLHAVLMDTRPLTLELMINDAALFIGEDFRELCLLEPMQHLESFHLNVEPTNCRYRRLDMSLVLESICEGIRTIRSLRNFKLYICLLGVFPGKRSDDHDDPGPWDDDEFDELMSDYGHQVPPRESLPLWDFFERWDPNTLAHRLRPMESLQTVHIEVVGGARSRDINVCIS